MNNEERRICEDFERRPQAAGSKTGSGSSLCSPKRRPMTTHAAPGEELPPEDQREHY